MFCLFSSRRRHTRLQGDWSSDVCSSDLADVSIVAESEEDDRVPALVSVGDDGRILEIRFGESLVAKPEPEEVAKDRKSTRLNSSHLVISYAVFCLKKKKKEKNNSVHIQV